jgi:four helix bundle protein
MIQSYKDLVVWKRGIDLNKKIYSAVKLLPHEEKYGLSTQLKRAAVSVPSNIAEGWTRNSDRHLIQYLNIAKGSLAEISTQLIIMMETQPIALEPFLAIEADVEILSRMIHSFKNKIEKKIKLTEK